MKEQRASLFSFIFCFVIIRILSSYSVRHMFHAPGYQTIWNASSIEYCLLDSLFRFYFFFFLLLLFQFSSYFTYFITSHPWYSIRNEYNIFPPFLPSNSSDFYYHYYTAWSINEEREKMKKRILILFYAIFAHSSTR